MTRIEGIIAAYKLQEWWLSSFTEDERIYMDDRYQPMGAPPHALTQGTVLERQQPATQFLNGLSTWFRGREDSSIAERIHLKIVQMTMENPVRGPGYYAGRHFTTFIRDIDTLKRDGAYTELEKLLMELVQATEAESDVDGSGVAPAYYEELAILYRKQKEYSKEIAILERFVKQKHGPGVKPAKLVERLGRAKALETKQSSS